MMKPIITTERQFMVASGLGFFAVLALFAFLVLPPLLRLFGVPAPLAGLGTLVVLGMVTAVLRRWPEVVEYQVPELVRSILRRLGWEVRYADDE